MKEEIVLKKLMDMVIKETFEAKSAYLGYKILIVPKELKSIIASAFMSIAFFTLSSSVSISGQSLDIPRLTFILVLKPLPTPSGFKDL